QSTTQNRGLTNGNHVPLIADLNNDSTNEIIIMDGGTVRLYQNPSLDIIDSITLLGGSNLLYSPPIINDIDEDGFKEIIISNEETGNGNVSILEYNGTHFFLQQEIDFSDIYPSSGVTGIENLISCSGERTGTEERTCLYLVAETRAGADILRAISFNATERKQSSFSTLDSFVGESYCFSSVASVVVADYDADNRDEFIFSTMIHREAADEIIDVRWVDVNSTGGINIEVEAEITGINPAVSLGVGVNCSGNQGRFFSSPVLGDFDGSSGTGLETVIGYNVDDDEYEMRVLSSSGSTLQVHPETVQSDGEIMGNPMISNVFGDTPEGRDYCLFGQDVTDQQLNLLCGTLSTGYTVNALPSETLQFVFDMPTGLFNLSNEYNNPSSISHMSQMQESNIDIGVGFVDPPELVIGHGVFQLGDESFFDFFELKHPLTRIFSLDTERSCTVVDYEQIGASDLICTSDTTVTYINDNLVNGVAALSAFNESPCIDQLVGINSTFQVSLVPVDQNSFPLEQDKVSTRVTLYDGNANEQVSFLGNTTSGTRVFHLFEFPTAGINQSGVVNLKYETWDTAHPSTIDTISQTFIVANVGVRFGDCTSGSTIAIGDEAIEEAPLFQEEDDPSNAINNGLNGLSDISGLAGQTIWYLIMIITTVAIWFVGMEGKASGNSIFGMTLLFNGGMVIMGAAIGLMSNALVAVLVLIGVGIAILTIGRHFTGSTSSN
ncbi:hypothetical protein KAR91_67825, partial [Candidatus Pacearchaeota archaeon]|nr:hypothetical protein [Candidatus Pacearchaeota archaeon]